MIAGKNAIRILLFQLFVKLTCSIADRIGAEDCGSKESNVSTRTSIVSGVPSSSGSSSPEDSNRSKEVKVFLQHIRSSDAASVNSPGRSRTCSSNWMSKYLRARNLCASVPSPQFLSCHHKIFEISLRPHHLNHHKFGE